MDQNLNNSTNCKYGRGGGAFGRQIWNRPLVHRTSSNLRLVIAEIDGFAMSKTNVGNELDQNRNSSAYRVQTSTAKMWSCGWRISNGPTCNRSYASRTLLKQTIVQPREHIFEFESTKISICGYIVCNIKNLKTDIAGRTHWCVRLVLAGTDGRANSRTNMTNRMHQHINMSVYRKRI